MIGIVLVCVRYLKRNDNILVPQQNYPRSTRNLTIIAIEQLRLGPGGACSRWMSAFRVSVRFSRDYDKERGRIFN